MDTPRCCRLFFFGKGELFFFSVLVQGSLRGMCVCVSSVSILPVLYLYLYLRSLLPVCVTFLGLYGAERLV